MIKFFIILDVTHTSIGRVIVNSNAACQPHHQIKDNLFHYKYTIIFYCFGSAIIDP
jgi:hypothetical protein